MNEIFFCQVGHVRASVACAYVEGAKLTRVALIREDTQGWPCSLDPNAAEPLTKVPDDWPSAGLQLGGRETIQTGIILSWSALVSRLCLEGVHVHHLCRILLYDYIVYIHHTEPVSWPHMALFDCKYVLTSASSLYVFRSIYTQFVMLAKSLRQVRPIKITVDEEIIIRGL